MKLKKTVFIKRGPMDIKSIRKESLNPFNNVALIKRYFSSVKLMDTSAVAGKKFSVDPIMKLWADDGELVLQGPDPIGEHRFKGPKELKAFYANRARGVSGALKVNLSQVNTASGKSSEQVLVAGSRYVVNGAGEGMQVPFAHKFRMDGGKIKGLEITVGKAGPTDIAPLGALGVKDLGRLAAMAWMVA
jgi:hypothetical protein